MSMCSYYLYNHQTTQVSDSDLEKLSQLTQNQEDQLCEQDKELLWGLRHEVCHNYKDSLRLVLQSVKWNSYVDVAKVS